VADVEKVNDKIYGACNMEKRLTDYFLRAEISQRQAAEMACSLADNILRDADDKGIITEMLPQSFFPTS